jgi:hypothetical protein
MTLKSLALNFAIVLIYFLPTILAYSKKNLREVLLLNLFFGWTVIGWIWSMIWAISGKSPLPRQLKKAIRGEGLDD